MTDLALDALAVHRLTRLLVDDVILDGPRDRIGRWAEENGHPKIDYLIGCHWCVSMWVAAAVVAVRGTRAWSSFARPTLALSAVSGLIAERA